MSLRQSEWFRPQPGEIVSFVNGIRQGVVKRTDGNICFYVDDNGKDNSYIWRFIKYVYPYNRENKVLDCLNRYFVTWSDSEYRDVPKIGDCYG